MSEKDCCENSSWKKMKDIYKDIESALDKCFSVSDEILNIALKNN